MKLSVMHRTSDYRGDHAADVSIAVELKEDETVTALAERLLKDRHMGDLYCDVIEIRCVKEPK